MTIAETELSKRHLRQTFSLRRRVKIWAGTNCNLTNRKANKKTIQGRWLRMARLLCHPKLSMDNTETRWMLNLTIKATVVLSPLQNPKSLQGKSRKMQSCLRKIWSTEPMGNKATLRTAIALTNSTFSCKTAHKTLLMSSQARGEQGARWALIGRYLGRGKVL